MYFFISSVESLFAFFAISLKLNAILNDIIKSIINIQLIINAVICKTVVLVLFIKFMKKGFSNLIIITPPSPNGINVSRQMRPFMLYLFLV